MNIPSPFPHLLDDGRAIVDEVCTCGGLRSKHQPYLAFGHGSMPENNCYKFSFQSRIFTGPVVRATVRD